MRSIAQRVVFFLALVAAVGPAYGQSRGNLVAILNAFVAAVAKSYPEYKADIALYEQAHPIPPGHQVGRSDQMGLYTFRPKTWPELSPAQQADVLHNPNLKAFILSLRNAKTYPAVSAATASAPNVPGWFPTEGASPSAVEYHAEVSPEEMLRNRTVEIPVSAVAASTR